MSVFELMAVVLMLAFIREACRLADPVGSCSRCDVDCFDVLHRVVSAALALALALESDTATRPHSADSRRTVALALLLCISASFNALLSPI